MLKTKLRQSIIEYVPKLFQETNRLSVSARNSINYNHPSSTAIWNKSFQMQISKFSTFQPSYPLFLVSNMDVSISMPKIHQCGCNCNSKRSYGRYEPDYLDATGPQIAEYEALNFQLTGYDFPVLEEFGKFVHRTAERMGFEVEDAWATPCKHLKITKLKPESTFVDAEYKLQVYERNVQLVDVPSTSLPLLIDVIQTALPPGVTLKIHPHFAVHDEIRYIPDLELVELKKELEVRTSGGTVDKRKKF